MLSPIIWNDQKEKYEIEIKHDGQQPLFHEFYISGTSDRGEFLKSKLAKVEVLFNCSKEIISMNYTLPKGGKWKIEIKDDFLGETKDFETKAIDVLG